MTKQHKIDSLYDIVLGDEDARVCKDIPDEACHDQPHNFFAYLLANTFNKIADEIASAKLILPWLFGMLGVPATFTAFLVPIREAGVLIPQLLVAAYIRKIALRKYVWLVGALLSGLSLVGMAITAALTSGIEAGLLLIIMLVIFCLSRGICSVSAKDVLGKTVSKSHRGRLMGWSSSISGIAILVIGIVITQTKPIDQDITSIIYLLVTAAFIWLLAIFAFNKISEQAGATEGGGNAISVAFNSLSIIKSDSAFRQFVIARTLLLSIAFTPPFYVLLAQSTATQQLLGLGILVIANGLAAMLASPFWGYLSDLSSKRVMILASSGAGVISLITGSAALFEAQWLTNSYAIAAMFFLLNIMHCGARLGRKVYLVDMANSDNRAQYVAISNTLIGIAMLIGGLFGLLAETLGIATLIITLALISLVSTLYIARLNEVS